EKCDGIDNDCDGDTDTAFGDLDGDGFSDCVDPEPADSSAHAGAGRVYAFAGADLSLLWVRDGDEAESALGGAAAPLGDVNDDGVPDVVAGAPGHGGAIYVLSGVDGSDVYPPLVADPGGSNLGHFFAAGLADLDDDGAPEVYGGDYGDSSGGAAAGKAYVWSGRTGARLFTFAGAAAGDGLGCGRSGGDSDGDGVADIAVGAYSSSAAGTPQAGAIFVYSGADGALLRTITGTTAMEQLGFDVVTIGDVDDDGRDDLLAAAANDNRIYVISGVEDGDDTGGTTGDETTGAGSTGDATTGDATTGDATTGDATGGSDSDATGSSSSTGATQGGGDSTATAGGDGDDGGGCSCTTARDDTRGARGRLLGLGLFALLLIGGRRPRRRP
ncbi:MAG: FG-GAP repeat protein, partial [Myxococcales bacterium]|nr:FG-GAP repeat protein [Myxococcales bacterium]